LLEAVRATQRAGVRAEDDPPRRGRTTRAPSTWSPKGKAVRTWDGRVELRRPERQLCEVQPTPRYGWTISLFR
jgi:hypothetical protein